MSFSQWVALVKGNLRDKDRLIGILKQYSPLAVMHFAASCYVRRIDAQTTALL